MTNKPLDDMTCSNRAKNGTYMSAERCDLSTGVRITIPKGLTGEQQAADLFELGGWHGSCLHGRIGGGFAGYDAVKLDIVVEGEKPVWRIRELQNVIVEREIAADTEEAAMDMFYMGQGREVGRNGEVTSSTLLQVERVGVEEDSDAE